MSVSQISGQERLRATMAAAALRRNAPQTAASAVGSNPERQPDAVRISDAARKLAAANNNVGSAAEARQDRIAALKAAIADGTYTVDSRSIARGMIRAANNGR